jgi:hypothetical protein
MYQPANAARANGNRPISIEVSGEPLGVVVRDGRDYRFIAVRFNAFAIDGRRFESVEAAREAARIAVVSTDRG